MGFEKGKTVKEMEITGTCDPGRHGTEVIFLPDKSIFEETSYDFDILKTRLRETAFLTKGLNITLKDEREADPENRRKYILKTTPKGNELVPRVRKLLKEWEDEVGISDLDDETKEKKINYLRKAP